MIRLITVLLLLLTKTVCAQVSDTLGYDKFLQGTDTLYSSPNGGYALGNNGYHDWVKAQSYSDTDNVVLRQVLLLFGHVGFQSQDSTSFVRVTVYLNDGVGVTSVGVSDSVAPDSIIAFVDLPVYQLVDNGDFSIADFTNQTIVLRSRFSVGVDLRYLAVGDTVGLLSTTDGDAGGTFSAWELASSNNWFTVENPVYSWGLDVDLAIFPTVDRYDPAGIFEHEELNLSVFPNPTSDRLTIAFPVNDTWTLTIIDLSGKVAYRETVYCRKLDVVVSDLAVGAYVVQAISTTTNLTSIMLKD
jgi:hypothetical protein